MLARQIEELNIHTAPKPSLRTKVNSITHDCPPLARHPFFLPLSPSSRRAVRPILRLLVRKYGSSRWKPFACEKMQFHRRHTRIDDDNDDEHSLRSTYWRQSYLTDPMESVNFSLLEWIICLRVHGRLEATRFEIVFTRRIRRADYVKDAHLWVTSVLEFNGDELAYFPLSLANN